MGYRKQHEAHAKHAVECCDPWEVIFHHLVGCLSPLFLGCTPSEGCEVDGGVRGGADLWAEAECCGTEGERVRR